MNESENPYKYGQILISKSHRQIKKKILSVYFDNVVPSKAGEFDEAGSNHHWKEIEELYDLEPTKTWEPLTKDNWLERRDKGVWVGFSENRHPEIWKLISHEKMNEREWIVMQSTGDVGHFPEISIYNDNGEEAIWKEE